MLRRKILGLIVLFLTLGLLQAASAFSFNSESEFLKPEKVFQLGSWHASGDQLVTGSTIAKGYYVYRKSISLTGADGAAIELDLPAGTPHHDEFFGETAIFRGDALKLAALGAPPGPATLHWQGCADAGICYPPQEMKINLPALALAAPGGLSSTASAAPFSVAALWPSATATAAAGGELAQDQAAAAHLARLHPALATLVFLGFGLLLAFTPCSLPMIPIVSTLVVGSGAGPRRALALSLAYVLAMAVTYSVLGVAAGLAGANLQAALQSPWLLGTLAALFLLLAVALFGGFQLRLPERLSRSLDAATRRHNGGSLAGAATLGLLSALLVGPCMTAPLAGALLYIGQTGNAVMGGVALFALGIGMGLPLLAIAVFGARVLPRPGVWMERVRIAFGYVMVGMAIYLLARFLPAPASLLLWGLLGLGITVGLVGWTHAVTLERRAGWSIAFGAAFTGIWSLMMLAGAASGGESALRPLEHLTLARAAPAAAGAARVDFIPVKTVQDVQAWVAAAGARDQWTLIDFYADWCVSCLVNERNVFGHPEVMRHLAGLQVLRPDVTRNDAQDQALLAHWQVLGPPTMILIAPDGTEARGQRMVGELDAAGFIKTLRAAGAT